MKITTVIIKEGNRERLWDEVESKYGIIAIIGSDYTRNEMAESARELFQDKPIFARLEKSKNNSDIDFMIFSSRHLSRAIFKAIAELLHALANLDDNGGVIIKTKVLKTLLSKKRYAELIR